MLPEGFVIVMLLWQGIQTASLLVIAYFFIRLFYSIDSFMVALFAFLPKSMQVIKLEDDDADEFEDEVEDPDLDDKTQVKQ